MSIKLISDGSVDLPDTVLEDYAIDVVPMSVTIDGQHYLSRVDISAKEFYRRQQTAKELPTTSHPKSEQFVQAFRTALERHDQVLCVCLSSALSKTYQEALQAAQAFPTNQIVIHDARTLSGAMGFQLIAAGKALQQGGNMTDALAAARQTHEETDVFFALDDLSYLVRSGRVGRMTGGFGSFLNIKPINTIDKQKGVYSTVAKVRSFKATMNKMRDLVANVVGRGKPGRFLILHGQMDAEAEEMANKLRSTFQAKWINITNTSPALGAYTGPRSLGIVAAAGDW